MQALHVVLRACYGDRPAGHWVVFHATISNVRLMAVVYGWSQRGLSYFISTAGSTELHDEKYISSFEDNFGNIVYREINRPKFAHFLYDNLPLIDEANKQRQSVLNLENCWSPKDCWFKLLITLTAMSVVDMHQWHRHKTHAIADAATRASSLLTSIDSRSITFAYASSVTQYVSNLIKGNGAIMPKRQAASVGLVQKWIVNHSFGFGIRMATVVGIQRSDNFKLGARQEIRSLRTVSCAKNIWK